MEVHHGGSCRKIPKFRRCRKFRSFRRSRESRKCRNLRNCVRFRSFCVDYNSHFRRFARVHRASDSTRGANGRTFVFAGRRSTFKGSQTLLTNLKSLNFGEKSQRCSFAHEPREKNLNFSFPDTTWRRFWSLRRAPWCSWALFLVSEGVVGDSQGAPGTSRDAPETPPERSWLPRDVPGGSRDPF